MTHHPPTVTPIEKIGDHLCLNAGTPRAVAIPCAIAALSPDGSDTVITAPGFYSIAEGWTPEELLRVMYPPTSYTTSGKPMPPIEQPADWDLDLSEIEDEPAPYIRPGSLPARALDELNELDWATASIVAERIGGVTIASVSQALRSLCERGLAERAKHPVTGRYMYRTTGVVPTVRKVSRSPIADEIKGALRRYGSPMAARQIVEALPDRNEPALRHALYRMVRSGQLRKGPHPVYGVSVYSIADEEAGK